MEERDKSLGEMIGVRLEREKGKGSPGQNTGGKESHSRWVERGEIFKSLIRGLS